MSFKTSKYASGFSPQNIPGLALWLDAADYSSFTFSSGSNISQWRDKSGNGRNAVGNIGTGTYSTTGLNSRPTVQITSSGNMISSVPAGTFSSGIALFVVFQKTGANNTIDTIVARTVSNSPAPLDFYTRSVDGVTRTHRLVGTGSGNGANEEDTTGVGRRTSPTIWSVTVYSTSPTTWLEYLNGTPTTYTITGGSYGDTATTFQIGTRADNFTKMNGNISEIIAYNVSSFSTSQQQQVESYLAWKWGLVGNLPSAHPYKTAPIFTRPFNPLDISGCAIWLDAADYGTFTFSSGSNVSQWNDKSGSGLNFSTTTGTVAYSNQGLTFPSGGAIMTSISNFSLTNNTYVFAVARLGVLTGIPTFIAFSDIATGGYTGAYSIRYLNGILNGVTNAPGDVNDFGNSTYYVNGSFQPSFTSEVYAARHIVSGQSTNSGGSTAVTVSGSFFSRFFNGDVHEVLFYSSPPSTPQRQQIELYLAEKWNLRTSLSTANPLRLYRALSPVFNPTLIPNCGLWLDAADSGSLTFSGSNVTQWNDKSGNAAHAVSQGTGPTYNTTSSALIWTGSQNMKGTATQLHNATTGNWSVFGVATTTGTGGFAMILNYDMTPNRVSQFLRRNGSTMDTIQFTSSAANGAVAAGTLSVNTRFVVGAVNTSSNVTAYLNGAGGTPVSHGTNITIANVNYSVGVYQEIAEGKSFIGSWWNGQICEIIVYSTDLDSANRQRIEGYLAWKWGLVGTLPSTHPYKKTPV